MSLIKWNQRLSVGVDKFDQEHQKLVELLNKLSDAMQAGRGPDVLGDILDEVLAYTASHFKHEEQDMERYAYPAMAAHKKEHADLVEKALGVQAKLRQGASATLSFEVLNFLKTWLVGHIQGSDKKFGQFLLDRVKKAG